MPPALTDKQKRALSRNEDVLRDACRIGDLEAAEHAIKRIQAAFIEDRSHFRILRAKLWYYEAVLDSGNASSALMGFEGIYARANKGTRIYLECSAFLGICHLRLKRVEKAKNHIRFVISSINDITSPARRQQFQQRLIERIEDECILSELIGTGEGPLNIEDVHQRSIMLVQKSDDEVLESIADSLPSGTSALIYTVTEYSIKLMPLPDQKRLPPPKPEIPKTLLGKKARAALKRIGWKTFCDERSNVHKLWSKGIPKVFNEGYFSSSVVTTLAEWRIGIPQLAAGLVATAMKFGCEEFCSQFRPEGLMIPQDEKG
jgi:hypothetical protein